MLVVADSNALMSLFRLGLNLDEILDETLPSWTLVVPTAVLKELEGLSKTNKDARAALALCKRFETIPADGVADDVVVEVTKERKGVVFTNDREVLAKAKEQGVPRLFIKGKSRLVLEGV